MIFDPSREIFERREIRYLLSTDEVGDLAEVLTDMVEPRQYSVHTIYLAGADPSVKLRLREYDRSGEWWLEHKLTRGDHVVKRRHFLGRLDPSSVNPLAEVKYDRIAWERGSWRMTADRNLRSGTRFLGWVVIEAKPAPDDLGLPDPSEGFSKYRWANLDWHAGLTLGDETDMMLA